MSIDDERREVAERLREQAYVRHDSPGEAFVAIREAIKNEDMIQNWHGESRRERQVFTRLASLIDPPGAECASACGVDLARLMLAHPDLPVLKLHTEADEDDNYVLKLTRARLGTYSAKSVPIAIAGRWCLGHRHTEVMTRKWPRSEVRAADKK